MVKDRLSSHTTFPFKLYSEHTDCFIGTPLGVTITAENVCRAHSLQLPALSQLVRPACYPLLLDGLPLGLFLSRNSPLCSPSCYPLLHKLFLNCSPGINKACTSVFSRFCPHRARCSRGAGVSAFKEPETANPQPSIQHMFTKQILCAQTCLRPATKRKFRPCLLGRVFRPGLWKPRRQVTCGGAGKQHPLCPFLVEAYLIFRAF